MARSIRIEFPGAFYHVMARGNRREAIFHDEADRQFFLQTLGEACAMTGWRIHAWVLLNNHYHLLVETPEANLIKGMQWLQNAFTRRFNTRHGLWGRLFGDRYKAVLVEGEVRITTRPCWITFTSTRRAVDWCSQSADRVCAIIPGAAWPKGMPCLPGSDRAGWR